MDTDISIAMDLEDFVYNKTGSEVRESFKENYGDRIATPIVKELDEFNLFDWFDVVYENRDSVTELDSVIGTKDLDVEELLNDKELFKTLAESDETEWIDPLYFSIVMFAELAKVIEDEFESDEEFIAYLKEQNDLSEEEAETIEELHESIQDSDEDEDEEGMLLDLFVGDSEEFQLEFASLFDRIATLMGLGIPPQWSSEPPQVGEYIVYTIEGEGKTGRIVLKVVDMETNEMWLSDLVEDVSDEEDILLEQISSPVVENIASEEEVTEIYKNHYLLQDINETNTLEPDVEDDIEVFDENPLPLE